MQTFENRFDTKYLRLLSEKLNLSNLVKSAVIVREDKQKQFYPGNNKKPITLKRAVKIDFAGISCTTLLGPSTAKEEQEQEKDIKLVYPQQSNEIIKLKKVIVKKFKDLLNEKTVNKLNKAGIYLQIRVVFPYLFSEFIIALIRAEDSVIWNATIDHEVSFSGNAQMSYVEWKNSSLYTSQVGSLHQIAALCEANKTFRRINDYDDATNTLETRFAVIPIPVCVMIINDVAITDSYIYAKVMDENHLAFSTPVVVIKKFKNKRQKNKIEDTNFNMLKKHFIYIWRHDLTMYAHMVTNFRENNPFGLEEIKPAIVLGTKDKPNILWQEKIDRIMSRKKKRDANYDPNSTREREKIEDWKENVIMKMATTARQIIPEEAAINPLKLFIKIWKQLLMYKVEIEYDGKQLFCMYRKKPNVLFCLFAHFALAHKTSQEDFISMHRDYKSRASLRTKAKSEMVTKKEKRIKNDQVTSDILFHAVFGPANKSGWGFHIPKEQITIKNTNQIKKATYPTAWSEKDKVNNPGKNIEIRKGCFDGLKLDEFVKNDSVITVYK